jgi:hypothetical protein
VPRIALLIALASACGDSTYVDVWFEADADLEARADAIAVRVERPDGTVAFEEARALGVNGAALPVSIRLVPAGGDASRPFSIDGELRERGVAIARVHAHGSFHAGRGAAIRLRFESACSDVVCDARSTCRAGGCTDGCLVPSLDPDGRGEPCASADGGLDAGVDGGAIAIDAGDAGDFDAGSMPDGGELDAGSHVPRYVVREVPAFENASRDSTAYLAIDDAAFEVETGAVDWLLFVTARISSDTSLARAAELRYLVDGVVQGKGTTRNEAASGSGPFFHFTRLLRGGRRRITVELKNAYGATASTPAARVSNLRLVAFPVPAAADLEVVETTMDRPIFSTAAWTEVESLTVASARGGQRVVLAIAELSEAPGLDTAGLRLVGDDGEIWPEASPSAEPHFAITVDEWQTFFLARALTADMGATLALEVRSASPSSYLGFSRIAVLRTAAFDSFTSEEMLPPRAHGGASSTAARIDLPAGDLRDFVAIQSVTFAAAGPRIPVFRAATSTLAYDHRLTDADARIEYGAVSAFSTDGAARIETTLTGTPGEMKEAVIHVFGL